MGSEPWFCAEVGACRSSCRRKTLKWLPPFLWFDQQASSTKRKTDTFRCPFPFCGCGRWDRTIDHTFAVPEIGGHGSRRCRFRPRQQLMPRCIRHRRRSATLQVIRPRAHNPRSMAQPRLSSTKRKDTPCGVSLFLWVREMGSNHRPSGYEPDELPLLHPAIYVRLSAYIVYPFITVKSSLF